MKLLETYGDAQEARRVCELLEEKGIPIFVEGVGVRGVPQAAVFVCIDSQFKDALTILQFPSHEPAQPIDAMQFHRDIDADGMKSTFDYLLVPGLVVIALCMLLFIVVYFINAL
jgi:hypothetical protein